MKESLNSDGQHFHQYQQKEQLPLTTTHWTYKKKYHIIWLGNPDLGLGQTQKCGRVKPVNYYPTPSW